MGNGEIMPPVLPALFIFEDFMSDQKQSPWAD
jgi:hypothetical protein